mmetsp:Transcript_19308/g.22217  ORF Transcript_19308/g.22217 Transcript_19308/m.22217 type:complete len:109 (+) Transcript_19308:805-1131(+)
MIKKIDLNGDKMIWYARQNDAAAARMLDCLSVMGMEGITLPNSVNFCVEEPMTAPYPFPPFSKRTKLLDAELLAMETNKESGVDEYRCSRGPGPDAMAVELNKSLSIS